MLREERLLSKKNSVYRREYIIEGKKQWQVEKEFTDSRCYRVEMEIVEKLADSGLAVPGILRVQPPVEDKPGVIVYEYIEGLTALDYLEQNYLAQGVVMLEKIICWLSDFYKITKELLQEQWILEDIHLRNFVYNVDSDCLYGLDFENACPGKIERDIAKLFLYIPTYEPAFTSKKLKLAAAFMDRAKQVFTLEKTCLLRELHKEASAMSLRRNSRIDTAMLDSIIK